MPATVAGQWRVEADRVQATTIPRYGVIRREAYLRYIKSSRGCFFQQLFEGPYYSLGIYLNIKAGVAFKQVVEGSHQGVWDIRGWDDIRSGLQPGGDCW